MISNSQRGSATIYQFPVGGRAGLHTKPDTGTTQPANELVLTDAWYHQEAIRDAQPATKQ
ncbi:MAG: hypothetical protein JWQ51_1541 [Tardiphaga sp.]|nr:hypothetical protein [Tardiphaga sp.]